MKFTLEKNDVVHLADGSEIIILDILGEGGQGIVYAARDKTSGKLCAFKWYYRNLIENPQTFYEHLADNIRKGSPSEMFVWPKNLTPYYDDESFGYTMNIIPPQYKSFSSFLNGDVIFADSATMIDAGLNIVSAVKLLHDQGFSYQDLNSGNIFINPADGSIYLCDTDNIISQGGDSFIEGTVGYMAPEIMRGEVQPDKNTDRYSLAVVLFYLLVGDHPLEGCKTNVPALTAEYEQKFFATEPLFIYDNENNSNAPVHGLHKNALEMWQYLPDFAKSAFQKSFSQESLLQRSGRLLEQDWLHILMRLKTSIVRCPKCHKEIFLESDKETICPICQESIQAVGYLEFAPRSNVEIKIPIFKDVHLYGYHMDRYSREFFNAAAIVLEKPGKFGLKNNSSQVWRVYPAEGEIFEKAPGEVVVLGVDFQIEFSPQNAATVKVNA